MSNNHVEECCAKNAYANSYFNFIIACHIYHFQLGLHLVYSNIFLSQLSTRDWYWISSQLHHIFIRVRSPWWSFDHKIITMSSPRVHDNFKIDDIFTWKWRCNFIWINTYVGFIWTDNSNTLEDCNIFFVCRLWISWMTCIRASMI